jgi:membrane protease YdiL (CAAX protease family)
MVRTAILTLWLLAISAPAALAYPDKDGGVGLYGETNDRVVTLAGFILIVGFPILVLLLTLLQNHLEKRKDRRLAAAKARSARTDLRGGW